MCHELSVFDLSLVILSGVDMKSLERVWTEMTVIIPRSTSWPIMSDASAICTDLWNPG